MTIKRKYPLFKISKALGKKTVLHLHCGSQIDDIWNAKYQYMFEHCDRVIVLSESLKEKVEKHIGGSDKVKVLYNPCPIIPYDNKYEKKNIVLFSGTLYDGKGYKDLIKAFSMIASKFPDWRIVLAGNGEEAQARLLAAELGISDQVVLLGWVNYQEKHKAFSEAKVFCLPSYAEGFPMAVLDAWAYGLPVITTPVGGIPDIAKDGDNMLLFDPGDIEKLADCLDKMISDENLRNHISDESKKLASTTFNLDTINKQIGDLYEELSHE